MAGKVFLHATMPLDGFITDSDGSLDWVFRFPGVTAADVSEWDGPIFVLAGQLTTMRFGVVSG